MHLCENCKIVLGGPPVDINSTGMDGDYVKFENYNHLTVIVQLGVTGAATTLTMEKDADGSGAGTAMAFNYRYEDTDSGDTLETVAAATSSGIACSTNDEVFYVVEMDAAECGSSYPFVRACLSDPSAATLASICYILSEPRYAQETPPTALS